MSLQADRERLVISMTPLRTLLWALTALAVAWIGLAQPGLADQRTEGSGIYLMGPGMPSVFTFDRDSMSCSVSWGTMGARWGHRVPAPLQSQKWGSTR